MSDILCCTVGFRYRVLPVLGGLKAGQCKLTIVFYSSASTCCLVRVREVARSSLESESLESESLELDSELSEELELF